MSKPFRELTKDFSRWRKFKIWIGTQKILWNIRRRYKVNYDVLERQMEDWDYVSVETLLNLDEIEDE